MTAPSRQLVLVRHAKAAAPGAGPDHDRPLAPQGRADAAVLGGWLKERGIVPETVLCSTAARTRETWAGVVDGGVPGTLVDHNQRIYQASAGTLVELLREVEPKVRVAVVVGHAPGIPTLASALSEGNGDEDAQQALDEGFPTGTAALLDVSVAWADLAAGVATITDLHTARA